MILAAQHIRTRGGMITPFVERGVIGGLSYGLSSAGYDVRIDGGLVLQPGQFALGSTIELFDIPTDVLGHVADKSTWARRGLALQNTIIEPGWRGFLTVELTNHGPDVLVIDPGMPIAQIIFHQLLAPTEQPYGNGKYQNQPRRPVEALSEDDA